MPKAIYEGREYARIGKYYYTKHAIDYMTPENMRGVLSIPGKQELRGIPPSVVENTIKYGTKILSTKAPDPRYLHVYENVPVVTDINSKVIISLGKRTSK